MNNYLKTFFIGLAFIYGAGLIILILALIAQKASVLIGSWVNLPTYEVYVRFWLTFALVILCYVMGLLVREVRR